jgi:hypothetical protein
VACAWRVQLIDGRCLPDLATDLIVAGIDPPSLVELAGRDLAPFDPRDAGDLLVASLEELEMPVPDLGAALVTDSNPARLATETFATHIAELILPSL